MANAKIEATVNGKNVIDEAQLEKIDKATAQAWLAKHYDDVVPENRKVNKVTPL